MSMNFVSPLGKVRTVVVICCFILIVSIFGYAYFNNGNNSVIAKDEVLENVETLDIDELKYDYVSSYIKKYGIGNINTYKFNAVEQQLEADFYRELPEEKELAKNICLLFVEHFYDKINLEDKEEVTDALLKCLIASLDDPYAYYRTKDEFDEYLGNLESGEEFVGIGVIMNAETLEILMVYPDSGAAEAGILPKDFIYAVDGKSIDEYSKEEVLALIAGEPETTVTVTVKRGEQKLDFTVTRRVLTERSVYYEITEDKIGIIQITQFLEDTTPQFIEAVDYCTENGAVALVIDVRYNPGGLVNTAVAIVDYLVPDAEGRTIISYDRAGDSYKYYTTDGHSVDLPIAVLCNERSASCAELFTSAMRDFDEEGCIDAIIVGTTTYGKGVAQSSYMLYDGSGITYTICYLNPPSGVNYDGIGIIPDVEVHEVEEFDAPLSSALEELAKIINTNGNGESLDTAA